MTRTEEKYFDNIVLDKEEQWYEDHESEFVPFENQEEMLEKLYQASKNTKLPMSKNYESKENKKPITLRLDIKDVALLKQKAIEQGLQYQSLISSVLHKYVQGDFLDKNEAKRVLKALK